VRSTIVLRFFAPYRRYIVAAIGSFGLEFNGAQDHDFALRASELIHPAVCPACLGFAALAADTASGPKIWRNRGRFADGSGHASRYHPPPPTPA
jgi:hypothetical protein